jgi:hypothetical protein
MHVSMVWNSIASMEKDIEEQLEFRYPDAI